jgi:hypothetical protein
MATTLQPAMEEGTYILYVFCTDEDGTIVMPNTIKWSLRDNAGNIVNSRSAVSAITSLNTRIVLSGNDLTYTKYTGTFRVFTLEGTYTSDAGEDLPVTQEYIIPITNLAGVT